MQRNRNTKMLTNVKKYGDCFDNLYITIEYFIRDRYIYYNLDTSKLGRVRIVCDRDDVFIENRTESMMVRLEMPNLNNDSIMSHAVAVYQILDILGEYVDVEIIVPDHSIFYLLTAYTGTRYSYLKLLNAIESRKGKVSVTLKSW